MRDDVLGRWVGPRFPIGSIVSIIYTEGKAHLVGRSWTNPQTNSHIMVTGCGYPITYSWDLVSPGEELFGCLKCFPSAPRHQKIVVDGFPPRPQGETSQQPQLPFLPRRPDSQLSGS